MRSRADLAPSESPSAVWRIALEWVLRALSVALLVLLLWRALHPPPKAEVAVAARSATLEHALAAWTRQPPASAVVTLESVPAPEQRDWLAALRHAGVALAWHDEAGAPTALAVTALPDPAGAWEIDAAAERGARLVLRDGLGVVDSLQSGEAAARLVVPRVVRGVVARSAGTSASAPARDSLILRRVLVEGAASWETRFTVAALQERGWIVDALMHVAPKVDVRVGAPAAPDTSRYALAIAVDTSARLIAGAASGFVRDGGGLVTLHDAAGVGPAGVGSVVLEQRAGGDVRAARSGAGRIVRISYPDLWRMRMAGGDSVADPVARHREWLARIAASVAYAPRVTARVMWPDDPAPFADLVARLGPPAKSSALDAAPGVTHALDTLSDALLAALLFLALLGEWLSRRLRGAR